MLRIEHTDGMTEGNMDHEGAKDRYTHYVVFCSPGSSGKSGVPSCTGRIAMPTVDTDGTVRMAGSEPTKLEFR